MIKINTHHFKQNEFGPFCHPDIHILSSVWQKQWGLLRSEDLAAKQLESGKPWTQKAVGQASPMFYPELTPLPCQLMIKSDLTFRGVFKNSPYTLDSLGCRD